VNTFRGDFKLARFGDDHLLDGLVAGLRLDVFNLLDNVVALEDLAEDDVATVEPPAKKPGSALCSDALFPEAVGSYLRGDGGGDEELRAIGIFAGVGHGKSALLGVLELEVLIGKLFTVD